MLLEYQCACAAVPAAGKRKLLQLPGGAPWSAATTAATGSAAAASAAATGASTAAVAAAAGSAAAAVAASLGASTAAAAAAAGSAAAAAAAALGASLAATAAAAGSAVAAATPGDFSAVVAKEICQTRGGFPLYSYIVCNKAWRTTQVERSFLNESHTSRCLSSRMFRLHHYLRIFSHPNNVCIVLNTPEHAEVRQL